jgi:phosphoribosyl 1,2-cyclic phosphate phosphodiesterase
MKNSYRFLGTGASTGIPMIGCTCPVCTSVNPKNKRLRTSGLLRWEGKEILVDAGPDLRQQALAAGLRDLDGLLITHPHYDHIAGLDELRVFFLYRQAPLPCLLSASSFAEIQARYRYLFDKPDLKANLVAQFDFQILEQPRGVTRFLGLDCRYFTFSQGNVSVTGFRFGDFAYVSDIREYPQAIFNDLQGVKTLILSALRFEPSHVHLTVDEAIGFAHRVRAEQTWLVHMGHELDHDRAEGYLPPTIRLSYDGLELEL